MATRSNFLYNIRVMKIKTETKCSLYKSLLNTHEAYPDEKAFYFKGKYFTYDHLIRHINQFAYRFKELGFKKDDVITIVLPNIPDALYIFYAANQLGIKVSMIHPLLKASEVKKIVDRLNSKCIFVLDTRYDDFVEYSEEIKVVPVSPVDELNFFMKLGYKLSNRKYLRNAKYAPLKSKDLFSNVRYTNYENGYEEDAIFLQSSGTSGESKTIASSNFAINSAVTNFNTLLGLEDAYETYILSTLPMFHSFGLVMGIHLLLYFGGCLMLMPKFNTKETISLINKGNMNFLIGVPLLYEALLKNPKFAASKLDNLTFAFVGGDFANISLINRFNDVMIKGNSKCRLYEGYGLTETQSVACLNTASNYRIGSVGKPMQNVDIKIVPLDENKPDEGEIYITGDTLTNGYRYKPDKVDDFVEIDGKRYLKTGDYGYYDEHGFLYLKQRIKRIIKIKGINIFPSEIENALNELEFVDKSVCVGKFINNDNKICVYLTLKKEFKDKTFDEEIINALTSKFGNIVKPYKITYLEKFKYNNTGKIDINTLD